MESESEEEEEVMDVFVPRRIGRKGGKILAQLAIFFLFYSVCGFSCVDFSCFHGVMRNCSSQNNNISGERNRML